MSHFYLTSDEIESLVLIGASHHLGDTARDIVFAFVNQNFYTNLDKLSSPQDQVRSDLLAMNEVERLTEDDSVPIQVYLQTVANRLKNGDKGDHGAFKDALEKVQQKITGRAVEEDLQLELPGALLELYGLVKGTQIPDNDLVSRYRWVDRDAPAPLRSRIDVFRLLADRVNRSQFWEVVSFVELIARHPRVADPDRHRLRQWVDQLQLTEELDQRMIDESRARDYEGDAAHRLYQLHIKPDPEDPGGRSFFVSIYRRGGSPVCKNRPCVRGELEKVVGEELTKELERFYHARFECFIPRGLVNTLAAIDQWKIEEGWEDLQLVTLLIERSQIYLRSHERQRVQQLRSHVMDKWKERWQQGRQTPLPIADCKPKLQLLLGDTDPYIQILENGNDLKQEFDHLLVSGVPVILWGRHETVQACAAFIEAFAAAVQDAYADAPDGVLTVETMRDGVHAIRKRDNVAGSAVALGKHITLFWDDPHSGLPVIL